MGAGAVANGEAPDEWQADTEVVMSDFKLFRIEEGTALELQGTAVALERPMQALIESNMEALFAVRFVTSEHSTGKKHGGRIDALGLDENDSPVIFEYKRSVNENIINQGLFYLDWLLDHRAEFELLVMKKLGNEAADQIDWSVPRLLCVASDFTKYDEYAIGQINRSIELVRYRDYEGAFLTLDLVASTSAAATAAGLEDDEPESTRESTENTVTQLRKQAPADLWGLYESLEAYLLSLGDDVTKTTRRFYYAYRRIKNFACVEIHPQTKKLVVYLKTDPGKVTLEPGFTRDVTEVEHLGTGSLEVTLATREDFERAQPLIVTSYLSS
jgi:predicted transport protein